MTLIQLDNGQTILVDIHVRTAADDQDDETPDVMADLRSRLNQDGQGRLYVDAFLLSHPDKDHICGLANHFHLGSPAQWDADEDKILIKEMWSSPLVFRRGSKDEVEVDDAKAWWAEARRRVARFKESGFATVDGDRILIMGEDYNGKTDDILDIVVPTGETIDSVNRVVSGAVQGRLLGPIAPTGDEEEEEILSKNGSSVIVRFSIRGAGYADKCRFLTGGDAGVAIWERLWDEYGDTDWLEYDILQTPHHCSWRSLSYDSYSEHGEDAEVCQDARNALAGARKGAVIVASSRTIDPDDGDPPSDRAKREYISILNDDEERFVCVADVWEEEQTALRYDIGASGPVLNVKIGTKAAATAIGIGATAATARAHGHNR